MSSCSSRSRSCCCLSSVRHTPLIPPIGSLLSRRAPAFRGNSAGAALCGAQESCFLLTSASMLLGQSRIFWTMADDGLLPEFVSRVHPKFRTPWITTIVTGVIVAIFAAILPIRDAASLVSIGTLLAFVIVSIGILFLRVREPDLPRKFKAPAIWFVAPMGAASALYLMASLPWVTWERLIYWFAFGIVIYFGYGVR